MIKVVEVETEKEVTVVTLELVIMMQQIFRGTQTDFTSVVTIKKDFEQNIIFKVELNKIYLLPRTENWLNSL